MWRPFESPAPDDDEDDDDDDDDNGDDGYDDVYLLGRPPLREYHLLKSSSEDPMPGDYDHDDQVMMIIFKAKKNPMHNDCDHDDDIQGIDIIV